MKLHRYAIVDAYTLEEHRRAYKSADFKGRICLLENLYKNDQQPPFEIALLAAEDPHVEVRQWIARNGKYLDYRETRYIDNQHIYEHPERNLEDRLRNDPDPFVRACLRENPTVYNRYSDDWKECFFEASHMERLALIRNPEVSDELIERIFDPEDQELGITMEERKELIFAFLTNKEALGSREKDAGPHTPDLTSYVAKKFLSKFWEYASKWPKEMLVQSAVYRYLPAPDETKAQIYRACDEPAWRQDILQNCRAEDTETIRLGMEDAHDLCRFEAYRRVDRLDHDTLDAILQREGTVNLSALADNKSLLLSQLKKVRGRLAEITAGKFGGDFWLDRADETIREVQRQQACHDPDELFDKEEGRSIDENIDFIGKRLLEIEQKIAKVWNYLIFGLLLILLLLIFKK